MPNEDSKLATELEQHLAGYILKDKKNVQQTDVKAEDWNVSIQAPTRSQQHFIQRQPYTGDA
jgi:hypothetical protein